MRKPKSLKGPAPKKERQRYKSTKGVAFPRRRIKRFPALRDMYRKISALEKRDPIHKNSRAQSDYFFSAVFSPKIHEHLAFLGWEYPPKISDFDKPSGRRALAHLNATYKRIANCSERELRKMDRATQLIRKELEIAEKYILKECFTTKALAETPEEAALVRHGYLNMAFGLKSYVYGVEQQIAIRKQPKSNN